MEKRNRNKCNFKLICLNQEIGKLKQEDFVNGDKENIEQIKYLEGMIKGIEWVIECS